MTGGAPVSVGIIGGGLMGREIVVAISRWGGLVDHPAEPRVTAVCDINPTALDWFRRLGSQPRLTVDYRDVLDDVNVDVVYVAVRHDRHEQMYLDAIEAGKDLLGEKPFGIDLRAAERISAAADAAPGRFVRCSSEMPFFPGAQAAIDVVRSGAVGRVIEASNALGHSSDLDPHKPLNWKRQRAFCGEAGVMNDLGMHACHVPLRLGWAPTDVYAVLQDLVDRRPSPDDPTHSVACDTFENATLVCTVVDHDTWFPLTLGMKRIDPGQKNTWSFRVLGMDGTVEYSTADPKVVQKMTTRSDGEQIVQRVQLGSQSPGLWPTITGGIFETGFSDAILQMLASFFAERVGQLGHRFGCATPAEAVVTHRLFTAALTSATSRSAERLADAVTSGSATE